MHIYIYTIYIYSVYIKCICPLWVIATSWTILYIIDPDFKLISTIEGDNKQLLAYIYSIPYTFSAGFFPFCYYFAFLFSVFHQRSFFVDTSLLN